MLINIFHFFFFRTDVFAEFVDLGGTDFHIGSIDQFVASSQSRQTQHILRHRMQRRLQQIDILSAGPDMRGLLLTL